MSTTVHSPALPCNPFAAAGMPTLAMVLAHLDGLDPALQLGLADLRYGLRPQRWANLRSLLGKALRLAGVDVLPGRYLAPLAPPWQQLAEPLPKALKIPLSRLMRYCSVNGIAPLAIDDAVLDQLLAALEQESLVRTPRLCTGTQSVPGIWPRSLSLTGRRPC